MRRLFLVHGGLWDDMDAGRFWDQPGIIAGLRRRGLEVSAPGRLRRAPGWAAEARHLAGSLDGPAVILAGSNGCSAAARLAPDYPAMITGLILAWPATAGDPAADAADRARLAGLGAPPAVTVALLAGQALRGTADAELASLPIPAGVLPSIPENLFHQRRTAGVLLRLLPRASELPGCPEPPSPRFPPHLEPFLDTIAAFAAR